MMQSAASHFSSIGHSPKNVGGTATEDSRTLTFTSHEVEVE
jgi:hypothetical protein